MKIEKNKEIDVKLKPEDIMKIKSELEANSSLEMQLELCNEQILVLEKNKESNKELLKEYYDLREKIQAQIKAETNT